LQTLPVADFHAKLSSMQTESRKRKRIVTITDVAQHAGVGVSTVSRAMNGAKNILEETRARVAKSAKLLGYVPNVSAQNLAGSRVIRVGVLCGNPSSNYTGQFLLTLLEQSRQNNCQLIVQQCNGVKDELPSLDSLLQGGVDGVLLPAPLCDSVAINSRLEAVGLPVVGIGTTGEASQAISVFIDNVAATKRVTRHLLSLGHRDFGFIMGSAKQLDSARRFEGFEVAIRESGLKVRPEWVIRGNYTYLSGIKAAQFLLGRKQRPTAILASNDDMAAATIAVAHRLNIEVPRDLSVTGFDDTPIATAVWPTLTTVRQPMSKMTSVALGLIWEEVRLRRVGKTLGPQRHCLASILVERDSSARRR
jgi:LacI family transcriptional regulator